MDVMYWIEASFLLIGFGFLFYPMYWLIKEYKKAVIEAEIIKNTLDEAHQLKKVKPLEDV